MLSRWSGRKLPSQAHRRLITEVADNDKSVRDAVRVPGNVLPVPIDNQLAKRIARLGDRDVAQRVDLVNCKLPAPCLDRPQRRARLGNASVDEPMLPQSAAAVFAMYLSTCSGCSMSAAIGKGWWRGVGGRVCQTPALAPSPCARGSGGPVRMPRHGPKDHYETTGGCNQQTFPMRTPTAARFCP